MHLRTLLLATLAAPGALALPQATTTVGFDGGSSGDFTGNFMYEGTGGNPDGNAHMLLTAFYPALRTGGVGEPANAAFLGDYSPYGSVTFSLDVKVDQLTNFFGGPISRTLGITLIDRDVQGPSGPSGVYVELGVLSSANQPDWTRLSVTIDDPTSQTLPAGWIGFGDEDPTTFEPVLPAGATFASVLASVDEFQVTGAQPGFFYTNATFDLRIDNLAVDLSGGIGTPYCTATPNSTGVAGETRAVGSPAVSSNDVTLEAHDLPPAMFGIFVVSRTQASTPVASGTLCLGGSIGRYQSPGQVFAVDPAGYASLAIDLAAIPQGLGTEPVIAGETWNFQAWHRDVVGGTQTANLALPTSVTFE